MKGERNIENKIQQILGARQECLEEDPLSVLQDNNQINAVKDADLKSVFGWLMFGLSLSVIIFAFYESGFLFYIKYKMQ